MGYKNFGILEIDFRGGTQLARVSNVKKKKYCIQNIVYNFMKIYLTFI